jgi:hypothetical protein
MADFGRYLFPYEDYSEYYDNNADAGFDMFERLPGVEFLDEDERAIAFALFYANFVEDQHHREDFFDYMNMDDRDFPWEEWREWMGYE